MKLCRCIKNESLYECLSANVPNYYNIKGKCLVYEFTNMYMYVVCTVGPAL